MTIILLWVHYYLVDAQLLCSEMISESVGALRTNYGKVFFEM